MKDNKIRQLLQNGSPSIGTRLWSTWPFFTEVVGATGNFDYIEFVAEYAPFTQFDLENIARAAELHNMGSMIKLDFQNRGYMAQKAVASGFQAILFADHHTPEDIAATIRLMKPETPEDGGLFGYANRRYIGTQTNLPQMAHAKRLREIVLAFMIEKAEAVDHIEAICSVPGLDMVQFGPADFSMSLGWNRDEHTVECKAVERQVIEAALRHGVAPRCEIQNLADAQYYIDLGVRHFCYGDQVAKLRQLWVQEGKQMRDLANALDQTPE